MVRIVFQKDSEAPRPIPDHLALAFYRAFRAELWRSGVCRDPQEGDSILGVTIVSLEV